MVGSRTTTALAGLAASLAVSVALWWYFDALFVFLFVPFVPFLLRGWDGDDSRGDERRHGDGRARDRPPVRTCPECGFRTREESFEFCPRDGRRLTVEDERGW